MGYRTSLQRQIGHLAYGWFYLRQINGSIVNMEDSSIHITILFWILFIAIGFSSIDTLSGYTILVLSYLTEPPLPTFIF